MSRSVLLGKIRHACSVGAGRQTLSDSAELPRNLPDFPCYPDPVARFREELEAVGGTFVDARGAEKLCAALAAMVEETGVAEVYWEGDGTLFEKHGIAYTLRHPKAFLENHLIYSFHFRGRVQFPLLLNSRPNRREHLAGMGFSVSGALCGIAETGTIVHAVGPGKGRLLSVLPPAHAVLLREQDILMNHAQFFEAFRFQDQGSAVTLVTGPSRTADIEKTLVLGVHGPQRCYVLLTC